ncbi:MAG: hypothetical protein IJ766_11140 [Clostridia bacterium]|nr:hypothetical protein [Clostridia bacterium]
MIDLYKNDSIIDVIHGSIPISGLERAIISTPLYNRMHRILQNSMVYLTFPCNKTKRFEHGIGTMYLAGEMYFHSIANAKEEILDKFFESVDGEIKRWYENITRTSYPFINEETLDLEAEGGIANHYDISDSKVPLYRKYVPVNIKQENFFLYIVIFEAIRLAALLHDVGHLPYSHIMEFALKSLYMELKDSRDSRQYDKGKIKKFLDTFAIYYDKEGACELHEEIGKKIVSTMRENIFLSFTKDAAEYDKGELLIATLSIDFAIKILNSEDADGDIFSDLHRIISGTVDADRLDYCSRDFNSVGIAKGFIDYKKLFNTFELLTVEDAACARKYRFVFCPSTKSLSAVEDLLYRRWKIYLDINYHHRVQKIHELMIHSVKQIAVNYLKEKDEPVEQRGTNNSIALGIQSIWDMLDLMAHQKSPRAMEMKLIQLDDSWFDTMVKRQFATSFQNPLSTVNENNPLWLQLHEFVSAEKHYYSLIKQTDDFYEFDKELYAYLSNHDFSETLRLIEMLNATSDANKTAEKRPSTLHDFIVKVTDKQFDYDQYMAKNHGFIFNTLKSELSLLNKEEKLLDEMHNKIPPAIQKGHSELVDVIVSTFKLKSGYDPNNPIYLSKHIKDEKGFTSFTQEFETMSPVFNLIKDEQSVFPGFYLYVSTTEALQKESILNICARTVSDAICLCVEEYLRETKEMLQNEGIVEG